MTEKPTSAHHLDEHNRIYAERLDSVDALLGTFYGQFPWPWHATKLEVLDDPLFETVMVNQELGDFRHRTLPADANVWVAGCGTNQALMTALRFPGARVVGSDVSKSSLEMCAENARELEVGNLELRLESINDVDYDQRFDLVVSTGVVHHNRDPDATLGRLARALKPSGVLELMVYNRFHRSLTTAFQKAVRLLTQDRDEIDFGEDLELARRIAADFPGEGLLADMLRPHRDWPESDFADLLIQPVEHSYTVASLEAMSSACGLEILRPCVSPYAKHLGENLFWELELSHPALVERYGALGDTDRWQVANLLLYDRSPLLWFYLRRTDAPSRRLTEAEVCDAFLDTRFEPAGTQVRSYLIDRESGRFELSPHPHPYPVAKVDRSVQELYERVDGERTMRELFDSLGLEPTLPRVHRCRLLLTTPVYPYLRAVDAPSG